MVVAFLLGVISLADFGGLPNDGKPDDEAMAKAIQAAIGTTYPDYRQLPIELDAGKYEFEQPIEWLPKQSHNPSLVLVGKGGGYGHLAYDATVLEFTHSDERPCIRTSGNAAHLEGFIVVAPSQSYAAIELGNDVWPGRVNEPGYSGDKTCNRSLIRNVSTWRGLHGVSVRSWGPTTLDRVKVQHASVACIRVAGTAIAIRDCYLRPRDIGIDIEYCRNCLISGGAIETTGYPDSTGIKARKSQGLVIDCVYTEGLGELLDLSGGAVADLRGMVN